MAEEIRFCLAATEVMEVQEKNLVSCEEKCARQALKLLCPVLFSNTLLECPQGFGGFVVEPTDELGMVKAHLRGIPCLGIHVVCECGCLCCVEYDVECRVDRFPQLKPRTFSRKIPKP